MIKNTERFSNRVENYVKYRPGYPAEVMNLFRDEMNLKSDAIVADIGAGTGISAEIFLKNGNPVIGIEPNSTMREASINFLKDFRSFTAVSGNAEDTTLESASVDLIVAAQAFHWFDLAKTRIEFRRIIRNNGFTALVWNERQLDTNDFLRDYERFVLEFGTDYKKVRHEKITTAVIAEFFQGNYREATFSNTQSLDYEGLKGRILSSSYIPAESHPRFSEMMKELKQLFTKHQKSDTIEIIYDTKVYYGKL